MTIVSEVASARAPAFTVNPRLLIASSMRSRVSREIDRLPDSAYDTVLRETPAYGLHRRWSPPRCPFDIVEPLR